MGALAGAAQEGVKAAAQAFPDSLGPLLGQGAYDLASRVRRGTAVVEPMPTLLTRFLTDAERRRVGL